MYVCIYIYIYIYIYICVCAPLHQPVCQPALRGGGGYPAKDSRTGTQAWHIRGSQHLAGSAPGHFRKNIRPFSGHFSGHSSAGLSESWPIFMRPIAGYRDCGETIQ